MEDVFCHPIRKSYKQHLQRIEQIVRNYDANKERGEIDKYIRAIPYHIKLDSQEVPEENHVP